MAIVDIMWWGSQFDRSFFTACSRVVTLTPQTRRVSLCVHAYRAFRTVQATLQTATAVVSRDEFVSSCGNKRELNKCCNCLDIRGHVINGSVLHIFHFICAPSLSRVFLGRWEEPCFPAELYFYGVF